MWTYSWSHEKVEKTPQVVKLKKPRLQPHFLIFLISLIFGQIEFYFMIWASTVFFEIFSYLILRYLILRYEIFRLDLKDRPFILTFRHGLRIK